MYKLCKTEESASRQKLLEEGLLQVMKSRPFEDVTVSDLCKQVGVPRNSFYRYFSDKESALLALIDHTLIECSRNSFSKWEGSLKVELSDLETIFIYWNEKRDVIDVIAKNHFFWILVDRCNLLLDQRKKCTHFTEALTDFAKEQSSYIFIYVILNILFRWYSYGFPGTPQEIAHAAYEMLGSFGVVRTDLFL